jgi:hypothetical protein
MAPTTADAACTYATGARTIGVGGRTSSIAASAIAAASPGTRTKKQAQPRNFRGCRLFGHGKPGNGYIYRQRIVP